MGLSLIDVIKHLMSEGIMANINQQIEFEIAVMVAEDMGFQAKPARPPEPEPEAEEKKAETSAKHRAYTEEEKKHLATRPPVVTIMGHVDHGKTKLLDAIRQANVAGGEAGGITQRIGAYQVEKQGRKITFLDTPGHQAFTAMRARGAKATDIAVLVVAADDGVMPQTLEAINHARAAQVPIIVAINKMDTEGANPENVKRQLSEVGLVVEDWGGDTISVEVSAKAQTGIDTLLDMILLVADIAELKSLPDVPAKGTVIEASIDKTRGPVATVLVHEGTLKPGDSLVVGNISGKIRAMFNEKGQKIKSAPPATPALILGLAEMPEAGMPFEVVADEKLARVLAAEAQAKKQEETSKPTKALTLDQIFAQIQAGAVKELVLVLKTDAQGSIEPIVSSLEKLGTETVKVNLIHTGTGNIGENDIMLAAASKAIVVGFAVSVAPAAAKMAETEGVSIRLYDIIYKLIEDVDKALKGMLEPEYKETVIGHARALALFRIPKVGTIVGSQVTDGRVVRGVRVRLLRNKQQVYDGKVASLKRFTEDAKEVTEGFECGIILDNYDKAQPGDMLEFYTKEQIDLTA
jgi:translation initiation factor IF-2